MGYDMYVHIERRAGAGWEHVPSVPYEGRRSVVFAQLAGVSNNEDLTPLAEPRGLPRDLSYGVYCFRYVPSDQLPDRRVTSWLTLAELEQFDWAAFGAEWEETDFSVGVMNRLRELAAEGYAPEDIRIVFWFDVEYDSGVSIPV